MSNKSNNAECSVICWGIAALVGLVSMILLYSLADYSAFMSILIGILIGVLLGFALKYFVCRGFDDASTAHGQNASQGQASAGAGTVSSSSTGGVGASASASTADPAQAASPDVAEPEAPASSEPVASAAPAATTAAASNTPSSFVDTSMKPSTPLAGEAELASRKGTWKYEAPAAEKAPAKKSAAKKPAAEKPAVAAASDGPIAEGKPELYDAAPAGGADDLKLISGVGPKLEQTLNDMGIYLFSQVAVWGAKEIAWVDSRLRFKGRIERDDWMSQAKNLAAGGAPQAPKKKT